MNRRLGFSAIALVLIQAVACVFISSMALRLIAVMGIDALAAFYFFIYIRKTGDASVRNAETGAAENRKAAAEAEADRESAMRREAAMSEELRLSEGDRDRLAKQENFLTSCSSYLEEQLSQNTHLHKAKATMEGLRSSLTTLNQYNENIKQNAVQVSAVAQNLVGTTEQGFNLSRNVQENVTALTANIAGALEETNILLDESKKISDILTIMSEIAVMTKVLSINASIVAARAGNKGKEFDVVAKEVRKLSVGTEDSLSNISALISSIQGKVQSVSTKLQTVSTGIIADKDSMLSVAGTLQGVTLAVEIIKSITDVSGDKAAEGQQGLANTLTMIDAAMEEFTLNNTDARLLGLQAEIASLTSSQ